MKVSLLQAKLWPLHANKPSCFSEVAFRTEPWEEPRWNTSRKRDSQTINQIVSTIRVSELGGGVCLALGCLRFHSRAVT